MRVKKSIGLLFAATLVCLLAAYTVLTKPEINIDGDVSDWDAAGLVPAYVDEVGDTMAWSKDPSTVGVGSTAEPEHMVEANDKCRDLKAVYFYADENYIYIRLDVVQLYPEWCIVSRKCIGDQCGTYPNVSAYHLYFHVPDSKISPQSGAAAAAEMSFGTYAWHFNIQFDAGCTNVGDYGSPWLQWPDWSGVSVSGDIGSFAVDLQRSAFEMRISRAFLEDKLGTKLGKVYVFIASAKPGEPTGAWGTWPHVFEPQKPGDPGEAFGACDWADYIPNDAFDCSAAALTGKPIEVYLGVAPPEQPPAEERPAEVFPAWIVAAVVVVVVVALAAIVLLRRRKAAKK